MNRAKYMGDGRYERVLERIDLLGIMDVSTTRQEKKWYNSMAITDQNKLSRQC